ncbi:MAG: DUF1559 domain-containing protein, partial [Planctomycetota bacterium]
IDKTWQLIKKISDQLDLKEIEQFVQNVEEDTGLDFENEILGSFDGTMYNFAKVDLFNPVGGTLASLKIKDPASFGPRFKAINEAIADELEFRGQGSFETTQNSGVEIHSIQGGMINFSWCLVDEQVVIALDTSALRSHLRKRKRERGKLISDPSFSGLFVDSESTLNPSNGDPIAVAMTDYGSVIQVVLPGLSAAFGNATLDPDFDFSMTDLPPVEVLTNGLKPNYGALYRQNYGYKYVENHVLPGNSSIALAGVGVGLLLPAVQQVRQAARRTASANNMRQLVLSCHNYEANHLSFPPAFTRDQEGKELLSWRVHLLPYLDEGELYEQFRLDEPWDSPHNKKLIPKMPTVFANPAIPLDIGMTSYLGVAGEDGVFAPPTEKSNGGNLTKGVTFGQITDGSSNTLLIVDAGMDHTVVWTQPSDFDPAEHDDIRSALFGLWSKGMIQVARADGSIDSLAVDVSDTQLREMMKKSDGKTGD